MTINIYKYLYRIAMSITLDNSNISVQYSTGSNYIIETVKSDLYLKNENLNNIISSLQAAPVTPSLYIENGTNNVYAVESYTYYSETANGDYSSGWATYTRVFPANTTCDILVVGGGGGGSAGGGGAGGYIYNTNITLNGTYTIKTGIGGSGGASTGGTQGYSSSIIGGSINYTAYGGGGGGGNNAVAPAHTTGQVGSYGGNGHNITTTQTYTSTQGNRGGTGFGTTHASGGGGGGAGGVGGDAILVSGLFADTANTLTYYRGGQGGNGLPNNITGATIYYAGGGTAGASTNKDSDVSAHIEVLGGGGIGARGINENGVSGVDGLGGGGGGGDFERTAGTGGGTGIVIIRYLAGTLSSNSNILTQEPSLETSERMYPPVRTLTSNSLTAVSKVISTASGYRHTLFLTNDGKVYSCGLNNLGQLGRRTNITTTNPNPIPEQIVETIGSLNIVAISAGSYHSLFLTNDGKVYSCGSNQYGEIGTQKNKGILIANSVPIQIKDGGMDSLNIVAISAGDNHSLFLTNDGKVYSCGRNQFGALGVTINSGSEFAAGVPRLITTNIGSLTIASIYAGGQQSFFLTNDGKIYSCGQNQFGQLGQGTTGSSTAAYPTPTLITLGIGTFNIVSIACGWRHTLFLRDNGMVYSCGRNIYGQLGFAYSGTDTANLTPTQITTTIGTLNVVSIIAAGHHSVFLTNTGKVYACGRNDVGQLGTTTNNGNNNANPTPTQITTTIGSLNIVSISIETTSDHNIFITDDDKLYACGFNNNGQLGTTTNNGTTTANPTPTIIPFFSTVSNYGSGLYTVSYSSFTASFEPFKCFNDSSVINNEARWRTGDNYLSNGTFNTAVYSTSNLVSGYNGDWLVIKLPVFIKLKRFDIEQIGTALNRAPKDFRFYGSTDGISWSILVDKVGSEYINLYYVHTDMSQYPSNASKYYNYFGLVVSTLLGNETVLSFDELFIYGVELVNTTLDGVTHKRLNITYDPTKHIEYQAQLKTGVGGWRIVRFLPPNLGRWYQGNNFTTTSVNSTLIGKSYNYSSEWSIPFGTFDEMVFATFDMTYWLYCLKSAVLGSYSNTARPIIKSSSSSTPYSAIWYNRSANTEDPWISIGNHPTQIVYGDNSTTGYGGLRDGFGGMCVLVRNSVGSSLIPNPSSYNFIVPVPTIADINNNSNIVLQGEYDIVLSSANSAILPKAGQYIPKPTTFTNYSVERMYPPVRNFSAATTTLSGQTYGNGTYVVSYSSTYGSGYDPFKCFNTSDIAGGSWADNRYTAGNFNSTSFIVAGYLGDWLKIQLPVAIKLTRFNFVSRPTLQVRSPKDFKIYGSNDNITWVELVNKTDAVYNASSIYEQTTPEITNTYTYYGLVVNKIFTGTNDNTLNFDEWYIYGQEVLPSSLSLRYNLLNPTLDPIGAQWTYSSNNTNVYHMGSVGIGTTNPEYHLDVRGNIFSSTGGFTQSGLTTWSITSDRRIKENIVKASYEKCLENVKNIELYNFNFKDNSISTNDRHQLGFIAQEVQQVYPKAVEVGKMMKNNGGTEDILTLNTTQIKYTLYGAVKKLIEKVDNIESKINNLYDKVFITPIIETSNIYTNNS